MKVRSLKFAEIQFSHIDMVGVGGSSPLAPTKFGRWIKGLAHRRALRLPGYAKSVLEGTSAMHDGATTEAGTCRRPVTHAQP